MRAGPKVKYAPWMCDCIIEVAETPGNFQAAMLVEIGKRLGQKGPISPDTFNRWRKEYPEFEEAWRQADILILSHLEKTAYKVASGEMKGSTGSLALLLNNKYKDQYQRGTGGESNTVNNTYNVVNLSAEDLQYKLEQKAQYLRQKGILIDANVIDVEVEEIE